MQQRQRGRKLHIPQAVVGATKGESKSRFTFSQCRLGSAFLLSEVFFP
jgi:hypothetical protein